MLLACSHVLYFDLYWSICNHPSVQFPRRWNIAGADSGLSPLFSSLLTRCRTSTRPIRSSPELWQTSRWRVLNPMRTIAMHHAHSEHVPHPPNLVHHIMLCLQDANAARNPNVNALLKDLLGQVRPKTGSLVLYDNVLEEAEEDMWAFLWVWTLRTTSFCQGERSTVS